MNTKHTAGEWTWNEMATITVETEESHPMVIAAVYDRKWHTMPVLEEREANAKLIAAAPDLLRTAEALLEKIGHVTGVEPERRALIAAITKATHETQPLKRSH